MNVARRVAKLEKIHHKKSRRFLVRYENPETGHLEPTDHEIDDYTKIFVMRVVKQVVHDSQ
jgi:hypothetical protein